MVAVVGSTVNAIGYSGMGYAIPEVKMLRASLKTGAEAFAPDAAHTLDGSYPIARPLYIYLLGEPNGATRDYLS